MSSDSRSNKLLEFINILNDISTIGIPLNSPEVLELRSHFNDFLTTGKSWFGTIDFRKFGRMADVSISPNPDKPIEVILRIPRTDKRKRIFAHN